MRKVVVVDGRFPLFKNDGKLELLYMQKHIPCGIKELFFSLSTLNLIEMGYMQMYCVFLSSSLLMFWYLVVIVTLHNYECIVHIFMFVAISDTPSIFNKYHYHCW